MNSKAVFLFILTFIFVFMWMPLHFDASHFERQLVKETDQVKSILHTSVSNFIVDSAQKAVELKNTEVFPERKYHDDIEEVFVKKRDNVWNAPYFLSVRALTELAVYRLFIALAWFLVLIPAFLTVITDSWFERKLKYEASAAPHPVLFKVALSAPVYLLGCFAITLIWPYATSVWVAQIGFVIAMIALHTVIANFHKFN